MLKALKWILEKVRSAPRWLATVLIAGVGVLIGRATLRRFPPPTRPGGPVPSVSPEAAKAQREEIRDRADEQLEQLEEDLEKEREDIDQWLG